MSDLPTAAAPDVILLASDRFFIRSVPLAPGVEAQAQVLLALESLAPFPVEQLFYGHLAAPAGDRALIFAAYRKRFASAETGAWSAAAAVLPSFLALLGDPPDKPAIRVWAEPQCLTAVAWDGTGPLPIAVLARETAEPADAAARLAAVEELRTRTGLTAAAVREFSGSAVGTHQPARESFQLALGAGGGTLTLGRAEADAADVRDKGFLTGRRATLRRDLLLWRGFLGCLIGLAAMVLVELAVLAGGVWVNRVKAALKEHAAEVQKIEMAQTLSTRIEELTERRLMPFEMLALVNENRPVSVQFSRTFSTGLYSLEIQAQTPNAADVSQYESVLRAAPGIDGIETRDLRARDGVTTFTLTVTFKPGALQAGAGS